MTWYSENVQRDSENIQKGVNIMRKLYKSRSDRRICGVCGGIAEYLGIDSFIVRLATVLLVAFAGMSVWIYVIAALLMSSEPAYYD